MPRFRRILSLCLLLGGAAVAAGPAPAPSAARATVYADNPLVSAGAVRLDVRVPLERQIPEAWRRPESASDPYRLVKFGAPVGSRERALLSAAGYDVISYVPYNSFLVRPAPGRAPSELSALAGVTWTGAFQPYFKIDGRLAASWAARDPEPWIGAEPGWGLRFNVGLHEEGARAAVEASLAALPGVVALFPSAGPLRVGVDPQSFGDFLPRAAALTEVAFIEPWFPVKIYNDENVQTGQSGSCVDNGNEAPNTAIFNHGITGWGARLAVADTCFDDNEGWFFDDGLARLPAHETSFPWDSAATDWAQRKIVEYYDMWSGDSTIGCDGNAGCSSPSFCPDHGSHVAGTMAGNCSLDAEGLATATDAANSNGDNDGMAPGAKLVLQDLGNGGLNYLNSGGTLGDLFTVAFENTCDGADCGIDAHNNSWGASTSAYLSDSRSADHALWNLRNGLIVTSAGNSGSGYDTVGMPGTAKNVVTVGNATNCSTNALNGGSSRGATSDGRLKPDVVAGGTSVTSTRNDGNGTTVANGGCSVLTLTGTSMASPTVAGLSALLLQYFTDGFYPTGARTPDDGLDPSGPLRKAMLVNTAQRMTGGGTERNGVSWPNMDQGWGFVVLDNALYFTGDSRNLWVRDEAVGVDVSGVASQSFRRKVTSAAEPLKVTLVWYDVGHNGSCGATTPCLNNDLDLTVTDESTQVTYGVTLVTGTAGHLVPRTVVPAAPAGVGQTVTDNGPDDLNTVEQVILYDPTPGAIYTFTVTAASTPDGPIPFGLVATGALDAPCDAPAGAPSPTVVDLDACTDSGVQVSFSPDPASWNDGDTGARSYRVFRDGAPIHSGGCAGTFAYGTTGCIDDSGPNGFAADYRIEYTNGCGVEVRSAATSATNEVSLIVAVSAEGATSVCSGEEIAFSADVSPGSPNYLYQWTEDGVDIPGATTGTLAVTKVATESHSYNCRVTDPGSTCVVGDPAPVMGSWTLDPADVGYDAASDPPATLVEVCGDGDGTVEPGEVWNVTVGLDNSSMCSAATGVSADLQIGSGSAVAATVCNNPGEFGDAGPGATVSDSFAFAVDTGAACPSDITFDVLGAAWDTGSGAAAPSAFTVPVGAPANCDVSASCTCSSIVLGEVSGGATKQLTLDRAGALVDLSFQRTGATHYNVYVSTEPGTLPFQVGSGPGKLDCDVAWTLALGGKVNVLGYDVEAGIAAASDVYYLLVTGDKGSPTESTLGVTSPGAEREADSYCAR